MPIKCMCSDCRDGRISARRKKRSDGGRPKHGRKGRRREKPWLDDILTGR